MFIAIRERLEDREEGFTLIELLVVVIIIGILAAIAIPTFLRQRERAWEKAVQSDLRNNAVIMEEAFNELGTYPTTTVDLAAIDFDGDGAADGAAFKVSPDVTVDIDAATTGGEAYCLTGDHASLTAANPDFVLDSDVGSPTDPAVTACS